MKLSKTKITVIGKNDYNKKLTAKYVRTFFGVPSDATVKFYFASKYYWSGGACYMVPIKIEGRGKYAGYVAFADFSMNGSAKSIYSWCYEPDLWTGTSV